MKRDKINPSEAVNQTSPVVGNTGAGNVSPSAGQQSSDIPNRQLSEKTQDTKVEEQVDARLKSALIEEVPQSTETSENPLKTSKSKKGIMSMIIFFVIFFLVLGVLIFLFLRFRSGGTFVPSGTKGEIVWWGIQHDISVYQPLIDEFEKDNPNIQIIYQKQSEQDYLQRLRNELASGNGPDVFEIHNTWPVMLRNELSTLPSSVMSSDEFKQSFYPIIVSNLSLEKGIVGMPLEYDAITLYINDDVFTSALKSPPDWWDELQGPAGLAKELTQSPEGRIVQGGVALGITNNVDHWPEIVGLMLVQDGVNPAKPTGAIATKVISFYNQFADLGVWNNTLPSSTVAFARGELAMYFGPIRRTSEIVKINPNLKFRTEKLPQLRKNNPDDPNYSYATYWVHGVSESSKVKEAAWTFLKFLSREDSLRNINNNIEKFETFKRVYPRPNMNTEMVQDPVLGSVIYLAYDARSFYLADDTHDGSSGINTMVNSVYEDLLGKKVSEKVLLNVSKELAQTLLEFGIRVK